MFTYTTNNKGDRQYCGNLVSDLIDQSRIIYRVNRFSVMVESEKSVDESTPRNQQDNVVVVAHTVQDAIDLIGTK